MILKNLVYAVKNSNLVQTIVIVAKKATKTFTVLSNEPTLDFLGLFIRYADPFGKQKTKVVKLLSLKVMKLDFE